MKYLIIGLNFLVKNPQASLENTIPIVGQPPPSRPQENKKSASPTLFKNASKFLVLPCRNGGGGGGGDTMTTLMKGGFL